MDMGPSMTGIFDAEELVGRDWKDVPTPAAVLDRGRLRRNCERMREHVRALGSRLRPHMKTLKCREAAEIAFDPLHGGIAVSTLNEARYFIEGGFSDICCTVCLPPAKFGDAARLVASGAHLSFFVDDPEVALAASQHDGKFALWIEIDSGQHRTGVDPDSSELLDIAVAIAARGNTWLAGVATHAGHSYECRHIVDIASTAEQERLAVVHAAERLRRAGFSVPNVSMGSTPTTVHAVSAKGITELRAGVYMAGDMMQLDLGSLHSHDVAFSVLASVIGMRRDRRQIVLDAGALALSKDKGINNNAHDYGYGLITDLSARAIWGEIKISKVYQEHGEIDDVPDSLFDRLHVGSKVRILPNHVCMTAAMYNKLLVIDDNAGKIEAVWARTNGWS
jgi:D-serine deaminase-like pyridoxal phosphate-dependent protein